MKKYSAREMALRALYNIDQKRTYARLALDSLLGPYPLDPPDRALATELVYGVTRRRNTLDWIINQYASRPVTKMTPWIRNILRMGVYQLMYLERIPASAAGNEAVELAKKYGHAGTARFVNGIMREFARRREEIAFPAMDEDLVAHISLKYSHPPWLVERWLKRLGPDNTMDLCEANNRTPPLVVRANRLKVTRERLKEALEAEGVEVEESPDLPEALVIGGFPSLDGLDSFRQGWFSIQDESSMMVGRVVAPRPGEMVIDACSAPGGKATHLAELMGNRGKVIAADVHEHKLPLIRDNCRRLGVTIVVPLCADGRTLGDLFPGQADRVLVDAPCSGLGVLRRRPDARWAKSPEVIKELSLLQRELLHGASGCVRPGGVLVYSTCTTEPEENEEVREDFLQHHPEFEPEDLRPFLPARFRAEQSASQGYLQLYPHIHGTDGFFIARFSRRA